MKNRAWMAANVSIFHEAMNWLLVSCSSQVTSVRQQEWIGTSLTWRAWWNAPWCCEQKQPLWEWVGRWYSWGPCGLLWSLLFTFGCLRTSVIRTRGFLACGGSWSVLKEAGPHKIILLLWVAQKMLHTVKCGSGSCPVAAPMQIIKNTPAPVACEERWLLLALKSRFLWDAVTIQKESSIDVLCGLHYNACSGSQNTNRKEVRGLTVQPYFVNTLKRW